MKEIKFRAWDACAKGMFGIGCTPQDFWRQVHPSSCDVEVMQYTGIKDKNGREVYEGDIVELTSADGYLQLNYELVEDMCEFWHNFNRDDPYYRMRECLVVGNVYENPELLK